MGGIESSVCKCEEQYQQKVKTMSNIMTESCKKSIQETAIKTKEALMEKYGLKEKKKTTNNSQQSIKTNNSQQSIKTNNSQQNINTNPPPQNINTNPPPQNINTNPPPQNIKTNNLLPKINNTNNFPLQNIKTTNQITGGKKRTIRKRKKISNKSSKK